MPTRRPATGRVETKRVKTGLSELGHVPQQLLCVQGHWQVQHLPVQVHGDGQDGHRELELARKSIEAFPSCLFLNQWVCERLVLSQRDTST